MATTRAGPSSDVQRWGLHFSPDGSNLGARGAGGPGGCRAVTATPCRRVAALVYNTCGGPVTRSGVRTGVLVSPQGSAGQPRPVGSMGAGDRARHGWDAAVTLVTPIERRWQVRWRRRAILRALDRDWLIRLGHDLGWIPFEPVGDQFKRLNHLHYARWSLVNRLPRTCSDQPEEKGPHTLLLFTSHFDFGWRRYLGTFIEGVGNGMQHLWADAPSWVAPSDGFNRFEKFVDARARRAWPHLRRVPELVMQRRSLRTADPRRLRELRRQRGSAARSTRRRDGSGGAADGPSFGGCSTAWATCPPFARSIGGFPLRRCRRSPIRRRG